MRIPREAGFRPRVVGLSLGALLTLGLVAVPASARVTAAPKVEILFVTPNRLSDFAMDGNRVAWIGDSVLQEGYRSRIFSRSLSGGPTRAIVPQPDDQYGDVSARDVALVGRRLFWVSSFGAHTQHHRVDTALVGARSSDMLADHELDCGTAKEDSFVLDLAGEDGTFAYSWVAWEWQDPECIRTPKETAHLSVFPARLTSFPVGSRPTSVAVSAGRIAIVERARNSVIVVYTPEGRVVRRLQLSGAVGGLGMSGRWIAAVTVSGSSRQLKIFDAESGRRAASAKIPTRASRFQIALSATHAVVASGRTVWVLDIAARSLTPLAERAYVVRGLSIEGRRVAWGERVGWRGRVVSTLLG
jgi:hypothetical protein